MGRHERQSLGQLAIDRNSILPKLWADQSQYLLNYIIYIYYLLNCRRLLYEGAYASEHGACATAVRKNLFEGLPKNLRIETTVGEQSQRSEERRVGKECRYRWEPDY